MTVPASDCLSDTTLARFAGGVLPADELEAAAAHVAECETCTTRLADADAALAEDPLLASLRGIGTAEVEAAGADDPMPVLPFDRGHALARRLAEGPVRLGRFVLLETLGSGSFGHVFRARDPALEREVALKVPRHVFPPGSGAAARFRQEARSAAALAHPGIVRIHEIAEDPGGAHLLVAELIEGGTLADRIGEGRFAPTNAAELMVRVARAVAYAHAQGVVHRDLKPSNILLDASGEPHVADFGLARRGASPEDGEEAGLLLGTPAYMAPEQARGTPSVVDARSDVYALGVVLYEMLTGERPFQGRRALHRLQVLEDDPRPPRQLAPAIPRDLETITLKAMARSRAQRYDTAEAFADDLGRFLAKEPIRARPVSWLGRLRRWSARNPLAASLLVAVTAGSIIGLTYLSGLSKRLMEERAADDARLKLAMLETFNDAYAEIVDRMPEASVDLGAETAPGKLPLPARLTIDLCSRISDGEDSGSAFRLYSRHPFPWRSPGGPGDRFEQRALRRLESDPEAPVLEFTSDAGRPVLRYARARVMKASCIDCHNQHPESPRTDWRVGDVRGALAITTPLDRDVARVTKNLRGAFLLYLASSLGVLAIVAGALVLRRRRDGAPATGSGR